MKGRRSLWLALGVLLLAGGARAQPTACCLPDGMCQEATEPAVCEAKGGWPRGVCNTCSDLGCPPAACINGVGSCTEPHATPGCEDRFCCAQVCLFLRPECCTGPWDESCARQICIFHTTISYGCVPGGDCQAFSDDRVCYNAGGVTCDFEPICKGDEDGDGVDDGCLCDITRPRPVPPTLRVGKSESQPGFLDLLYDVVTCNASDHMLLFGRFPNFTFVVATECSIGNDGSHTTPTVQGSKLWFLVAGREDDRFSSVGQSSSGERFLEGPSCGLVHDPSASCP